jgi:hypothetical protein
MDKKFSELQKNYPIPLSANFAGYDSGGTGVWPGSALQTFIWSQSADYNIDKINNLYNTTNSNSGNWNTTYTTVANNSSMWNYQGTDIKSLTGNWQDTYSTVAANSSLWIGGDVSTPPLTGGTTNQIIQKTSNKDYSWQWKNKRTTLTLPTLTSTGNITCNALSADQFVVSVSGATISATFTTPTNPYDAQIIMWNIRYNTNIAGVSLSSDFRIPTTTLNWSASANRMDIFAAKYNQLDSRWDVISFAPGYLI